MPKQTDSASQYVTSTLRNLFARLNKNLLHSLPLYVTSTRKSDFAYSIAAIAVRTKRSELSTEMHRELLKIPSKS